METSKDDAEVLRAETFLAKLGGARGQAVADRFSRRVLIVAFVVFCLLVWIVIGYAVI
ncbi:hypothetical protein [Microvirga flavescens]|uniref:hypothetical protein n=1 Tax=Microvirga flavescens TaxID=2249811 RepID=UPI0013005221|nr:hypothetical protein [Microvirga flavescens]